MNNDGETFLAQLASLPADTFESRFSKVSRRLGLGSVLNRNELTLLYEAALHATLCNAVINGLAGRNTIPNAQDEPHRIKSEREFMVSREIFFASAGWQNLATNRQRAIRKLFLNVFVAEDKLA